MKRYFAIVWPKNRLVEASMLSGYEREGAIIAPPQRELLGFALDVYPDEIRAAKREFGDAIIGDFATRAEAEAAIWTRLRA